MCWHSSQLQECYGSTVHGKTPDKLCLERPKHGENVFARVLNTWPSHDPSLAVSICSSRALITEAARNEIDAKYALPTATRLRIVLGQGTSGPPPSTALAPPEHF